MSPNFAAFEKAASVGFVPTSWWVAKTLAKARGAKVMEWAHVLCGILLRSMTIGTNAGALLTSSVPRLLQPVSASKSDASGDC